MIGSMFQAGWGVCLERSVARTWESFKKPDPKMLNMEPTRGANSEKLSCELWVFAEEDSGFTLNSPLGQRGLPLYRYLFKKFKRS